MQVHTDGHLTIEFAFDSFMRIRHWKFIVKDTTEYLPKSSFNEKDESKAEEMAKNVMEHGQPPKSLHYLRVSLISYLKWINFRVDEILRIEDRKFSR